MPVYRHELKHEITVVDAAALGMRLSCVARHDPHAGPDGRYRICSLYFDDPADTALREKLDGVCDREKFRIRYYGNDLTFISLEKKVKRGGAGYKLQERMTREEVERLLAGETRFLAQSGKPLFLDLYTRMKAQGLRPRVVVQYEREPFVYEPGNVRVTLDSHLRCGPNARDFLDPGALTLPTLPGFTLLEVKWDDVLPEVIRRAVQLHGRGETAFSKYAQCRMYG